MDVKASSPAAATSAGRALHEFAARLYPICRSITGAGVRKTLALIRARVPLIVHEVPSGTRVFAPGTIGSLTWLKRNESRLSRVRHALVLALLGDPGALTYSLAHRQARALPAGAPRSARLPAGPGERAHEGRIVLRGSCHAAARALGHDFKAAAQDRLPADPVAPHALLRAFRTPRFHPVPRIPRRPDPRLFPELQRSHVERLHPARKGSPHRAARSRHRRLEYHLRRYGLARHHRRAFAARAQIPGQ